MSTHVDRQAAVAARRSIEFRLQRAAERNEALPRRAATNAKAVIELIVEQSSPRRVYQWGSLLRESGFREYSDIDIALEGVTDDAVFFRILREAQELTSFPLDIVQLEKTEPEFAASIRQYGKLIYERA